MLWVFCLRVCLYTTCVPGAFREPKKKLYHLVLKLEVFGACHIDAGNQAQVPGRTASALSHQAISSVPHFLVLIWWGRNYFAID